MGILTVRNVPEEVHRALRKRAATHGRSTEADVRDILERAVKAEQSIRPGDALAQICRKSDLLPDDRRVCSSLTHANTIAFILESYRKNRRTRRPTFACRQCRYAGPKVLPWRYSSRAGSPGTTTWINW